MARKQRDQYMQHRSEFVTKQIGTRTVTLPRRIADLVHVENEHWIWQGDATDGYGRVFWNRRRHRAHRYFYESLVGPIPDGLVIDHLCRVTMCVNPDHLEPVTPRENTARGIGTAAHAMRTNTCIRGHEFTEENTEYRGSSRVCIACIRQRTKEKTKRNRANRIPKPRVTHCKHGHEFTEENTYYMKDGRRNCRICLRRASAAYSKRQRGITNDNH